MAKAQTTDAPVDPDTPIATTTADASVAAVDDGMTIASEPGVKTYRQGDIALTVTTN